MVIFVVIVNQFDGIDFPCDDIINLMIEWFARVMVYLMERGSHENRLWKMPLSMIICDNKIIIRK